MPTHIISVDGNSADSGTGNAVSGTYLAYVALLNQTAEGDPVATVLNASDPNYLGNIVWTRTGQGVSNGTLTGVFTAGKTFMQISQSDQGYNCIAYMGKVDVDKLYINTYYIGSNPDLYMQLVDDCLIDNVIEIRVYQ